MQEIINLKSLAISIRDFAFYDALLKSYWKDVEKKNTVFKKDSVQIFYRKEEWDSSLFGLKVIKVEQVLFDTLDELSSAVEAFFNTVEAEYFLFRFSLDNYRLVQILEGSGCIFLDSTVDLSLKVEKKIRTTVSKNVVLADESMTDKIVAIASAFHHGRFFTDPEIKFGTQAYRQWIQNSLKKSAADGTFVYQKDEMIHGFLTYKIEQVGDYTLLEIPLVGKSLDSKEPSVAVHLLEFAKKFAYENGCHAVLISTQSTNIPAQRSYISAGFKPYNSGITMRYKK